jgi:hypothetical protein
MLALLLSVRTLRWGQCLVQAVLGDLPGQEGPVRLDVLTQAMLSGLLSCEV